MLNRDMRIRKSVWLKHLLFAVFMMLVGAGLGTGKVFAESKTVNVPGIGNVGTARTDGIVTTGTKGVSTASTPLYNLRAHIRIWHNSGLQWQDNKNWFFSNGGNTLTGTSTLFGDYSVTLHTFQFVSGGPPNTVYTSMGSTGYWSCASSWNNYRAVSC